MSGISVNYTQLFSGSTGTDDSGTLLSTLYSTSVGGGDPITALMGAEQNQTKDIAATAKQSDVSRDIAAFTAAVGKATSAKQLLSDPTVLKVLLTANGLGDQTDYTALAQKALLSDPTDTTSVAYQLKTTNSSWLAAATTYQFATKGLAVIQQPSVLASITNGYAEVKWRESLDDANPGLSNALTFRDQASTITGVDQVLADPVLRDVITTALGLPQEIAEQPLDTQERAITSRIDLTQFKSATFTEQFIRRYLLEKAADVSTGTTGSLVV